MKKCSLQEQKVLKNCNLKSFKNVSKDNIMNLYSQLKTLSPEIQSKVLDEINHFQTIAGDKLKNYKELASESLKSAKDSEDKLHKIQLKELNNLQSILNTENLTFDQKMQILDRMSIIENNAKEAKNENHNFILNFLTTIGKFFVIVLGLVTTIFIGKNIFDKKDL